MALDPTLPVVAPGELITASHLNGIRSNLDRLDNDKVSETGATMTGTLIVAGAMAPHVRLAGAGTNRIDFTDAAQTTRYGSVSADTGTHRVDVVADDGSLALHADGVQSVTLDGAQALFGKTSSAYTTPGVQVDTSGADVGRIAATSSSTGAPILYLNRTDTAVGKAFVQFAHTNTAVVASYIQGNASANGVDFPNCTVTAPSDGRLKDDLGPLADGLAKVNALTPKRLRWKSSGIEFDGFIAQEMDAVLPDAVVGDFDLPPAEAFVGINFDAVVPWLVVAVQELSARVAALEAGG